MKLSFMNTKEWTPKYEKYQNKQPACKVFLSSVVVLQLFYFVLQSVSVNMVF